MKNTLLGVGLGVGFAGVVVAIVLALSGGGSDDEMVIAPAVSPPAATAGQTPGGSAVGGSGGASVPTGAGTEQFARAYCEREQADPDDFQREFGSGEAGMANCIQQETQLAVNECEAELRTDSGDYERQFGGTDDAAFQRCLEYELTSF